MIRAKSSLKYKSALNYVNWLKVHSFKLAPTSILQQDAFTTWMLRTQKHTLRFHRQKARHQSINDTETHTSFSPTARHAPIRVGKFSPLGGKTVPTVFFHPVAKNHNHSVKIVLQLLRQVRNIVLKCDCFVVVSKVTNFSSHYICLFLS